MNAGFVISWGMLLEKFMFSPLATRRLLAYDGVRYKNNFLISENKY